MKKPTPEKVKEILYSNAEDLHEIGFDINTGHGRVTTDFIEVGKIVNDQNDKEYGNASCLGVVSGVVVGLFIWAILLIML